MVGSEALYKSSNVKASKQAIDIASYRKMDAHNPRGNDGTHWSAGASSSSRTRLHENPVIDRETYEAWVNQQRSQWNLGAVSARPRELESGRRGQEAGQGEYLGGASAGSDNVYGQHNPQEPYTGGPGQHARQGAHAQSVNDMQAQANRNAAFLAQGGGNAAAATAATYGQPGNDRGVGASGSTVNQLSRFHHLTITSGSATSTELATAADSDDTGRVFIVLYSMSPVPNDPHKGWHVTHSRVVMRRPGGAQLRQGRSVPPPTTSPEWNVWTVGDLDYENARGGLHLDYLREVLFRLDGVSRRKVGRPTLVALVQAERHRQIAEGCVVDCPPYFEERAHWYNYVQPM